ncbi:GTA-gp10 family protein [Sphingobium bisphenolivorans]|uniref:GTA-gp10 family protein n=1 Tax=Sphingobium bisphenolivorans TaxID=1335760 RepID=UPI00039FE0DB|nr:GTA-gp10 family protein [Sphingobium bisphenolivorans]
MSREANNERGELTLTLDGEPVGLRPSYEAIHAFERATGKGLMELAQAALAGTLSAGDTAIIACECVRAWGRSTENKGYAGSNPTRIAELMIEAEGGFSMSLSTIAGMLAMATTGGYTAAGELKPTATKKTTESAPAVG